jgi:hypothetical protein
MKYILCALFFIVSLPVLAQTRDVPVMTFPQKVDIVYQARKNPVILELTINQDKARVTLDATVDKNTDRDMAKAIALNVVMLTKTISLDDKPTEKGKPGKGLYDYVVTVRRADAVILVVGHKPAKKVNLRFDPPALQEIPMRPLTRADGTLR